MSLRSPTEYENGRIFLHKDISPSRHSRESGNPGSSHRISLDTPWSLPSTPIGGGYDGIQDAAFLLAPSSIFEEGAKDTKNPEIFPLTFVLFVSFVVKVYLSTLVAALPR
jgi:hypothetical protein